MSREAPWFALAADWMDSEMFDEATDGCRLAWVCLLCHVKTMGRAGRAKMRQKTFQRQYNLSERAVSDMLDRAQKCGAAEWDGETVTLCNWRIYQHDKVKGKGGRLGETGETPTSSQNSTTVPITHHQSPSPPQSPHKGGGAVSYPEDSVDLPPELDSPEFRAAWVEWCRYRRERKNRLTQTTISRQFSQMKKWGRQRSIEAIEHTIFKGWQGLVEPDGQKASDRLGRCEAPPGKYDHFDDPNYRSPSTKPESDSDDLVPF